MTEQTIQPSRPRPNLKWIAMGVGGGCVLLACVGLVVALIGAAVFPAASRQVQTEVTSAQSPVPAPTNANVVSTHTPAIASGQIANTLGNPSAPVKIIEYADFQCPYCRRYWQETEPQIIETYVKTGKVFYEYRSVGAFIGQESADAAQAAYCAGDQGRFWEYHDALFQHWTGENVGDFTKARLDSYASALGLELSSFDACMTTGKYANRIQQDVANAKADGIQATPSFLINGKLVEGAEPFSTFQQEIEAALKGP